MSCGCCTAKLAVLEPIRRQSFAEPDRQSVHDAALASVQADPERYIRAYLADPQSFGGRYIAADLFKEHFPDFHASKEARNRYNAPVHNPAAVLSAEMFRRRLTADEPSRDTAVFLTGVPGAGKTSQVLVGGQLPDAVRLVFEGQLAKPGTTIEKLQQVLDAGLRPVVRVVHARPEDALHNTLLRFTSYGRGASINVMADIQGGLPDSLKAVHDRFGDQVALRITDGRDRSQHRIVTGWSNLDLLRSEGNRDEIRNRLAAALETHRPQLSDAAWRQAAGMPPSPDHGRLGARHPEQSRPYESGPGLPRRRDEASELTPAPYDAGHQARAQALRENPSRNVLQRHPELAGAVSLIERAAQLGQARGMSSERLRELHTSVVSGLAEQIAKGRLPEPSMQRDRGDESSQIER